MMKKPIACVRVPCENHGEFSLGIDPSPLSARMTLQPNRTPGLSLPGTPPMIIFRSRYSVAALILSLAFPFSALAQQPLPAEGDESTLIAVLNSDAELFEKAKACQRLSIIGTSESVPVLANLLAEPKLSHYARTALEANPSSEVDKAFRKVLGELTGRQLVGVINSIATRRRDAGAVDELVRALDSDDEEVAAAAVSALGALASPESIAAVLQTLSEKPSLRVTAADASLTAADTLLIKD
jgi:hypothetical protein